MIAVLITMISVAIIMAAGMIAVLEMAWPALIVVGVVVLGIYLMDRFGVLPDKRKKRPSKNKRYRRNR